jgi:hypothetical protein
VLDQRAGLPWAAASKPLLETGREAGVLDFADVEDAFRTFFGLVVRDVQIRALLGEDSHPGTAEISKISEQAARQFLTLYGRG